jgi:MFS family permease
LTIPDEDRGQSLEDAEDALVDGDRTFEAGGARAALAHPTFRTMFTGAFLSNIGSWMQNVVLAALAYELTGSSAFVGLIIFAQLGPLLLLSMIGGLLADLFDRRKLLAAVAVEQMAFSLVLAWLARDGDPSRVGLVAAVFAIGVGQAVFGPTYSALLPALVGRRDLAGAISLNSAQMNGSRVIGPAIGGLAYAKFGPAWVFAGNAVTYFFILNALRRVTLPRAEPPAAEGPQGLRRLAAGFGIARRDPIVGRCLSTIALFSFLCLPFIGQMPVVAADNLGIQPRSTAYGLLYACFGLGAVIGALSVGTVLAGRRLDRLARTGLAGFAVALTVFSLLRQAVPAYPVILLVGMMYFLTVTSLSTVLQSALDDRQRGRVMALWIMGFGGTVPIGNLVAGPIIEVTSITTVLLGGAAAAVLLSLRWHLAGKVGSTSLRT